MLTLSASNDKHDVLAYSALCTKKRTHSAYKADAQKSTFVVSFLSFSAQIAFQIINSSASSSQ